VHPQAKTAPNMFLKRAEEDEKQDTPGKKWIEGYRKWKNERCPHN